MAKTRRPKVFTIGYATHTPASLLEKLRAAGVEVLIDVRELPLSRRPGFSKGPLANAATAAGVEYRHFKSLGVPSALRNRRKAGELDGPAYMEAYRKMLKRQPEVLNDALEVVKARPCCLLCLEAEPAECHRSIVAEELGRVSPAGITVEHL
jgi:Uncharacterized conserved protein